MNPLSRIRIRPPPTTKTRALLLSSRPRILTSTTFRPYSQGGYGDTDTKDPTASHPLEQGASNPVTENLEHPHTKPSSPKSPNKPSTSPSTPSSSTNPHKHPQEQQQPGGEPRSTPAEGKPTMRDDWNDVSNQGTNLRPEEQDEGVRRHNEEVDVRHGRERGRDKMGGRER
ncbi:hypothetical protein FQN54_003980 [Arachnomyces sp. PD_36]|nr:hypothetical protein FQN54_003980 [Arachnomyces sp. PD_36]